MFQCTRCHAEFPVKEFQCRNCKAFGTIKPKPPAMLSICPKCGNSFTPPRCQTCGRPVPPNRPAPRLDSIVTAANLCAEEQALRMLSEETYKTNGVTVLYRTDTRLLREIRTSLTDGESIKFPPAGFNPYEIMPLMSCRELLRHCLEEPRTLSNMLNNKIYGNLSQPIAKKLVSTAPQAFADNPGGQVGTTPLKPWERYKPIYQIFIPELRAYPIRQLYQSKTLEKYIEIKANQSHQTTPLVLYMNRPMLSTATMFGVSHHMGAAEVTLFIGIPQNCVFLFRDGEHPAGLHHYARAVPWGTTSDQCPAIPTSGH